MLTIEVKDRYNNDNVIIVMINQIEAVTEFRGLATIRLISGNQIEVYHSALEVKNLIELNGSKQ